MSPSAGPTSGATGVTIVGTNFPTTIDSVRVGAGRLGNLERLSATQLTGVTPASIAVGTVDVTIYATGPGAGTCTGCFTYTPAVTVTGVSPSSGPAGTAVTITGMNFPMAVNGVRFGPSLAEGVVRVSATQLTGTAPPTGALGTVDVTVYTTSDGIGICTGCFTYTDPVTVTAVFPGYGPQEGGTPVMITGNFPTRPDSVLMGGVRLANLAFVIGSLLKGTTTARSAPGPVDVTVYSASAGNGTCVGCFTYDSPDGLARYSVTFLGAGFDSSVVADINDSGTVAGRVWTAASGWHGRLWTNAGAATDLDTLLPIAINNAASVIGRLGAAWDRPPGLWENGVTRQLGGLDSIGPTHVYPTDINDRRQVALSGYIWQNDSLTPLQLGFYMFEGFGRMNSIGEVAASGGIGLYPWAFVLSTGAPPRFLPGGGGADGRWSRATALNDSGVAVGTAEYVMGYGGGGILFGTGPLPFTPAAINNSGQVVGGGSLGQGGAAAYLSSLVVDRNWQISGALAINNRGQIAAYGINTSTGERGAIRLDPVATPSGSSPARRR